MSEKEHILRLPTIVSNIDFGDSKDLERKNVFIIREQGEKTYIGIYLGQAFVYLDDDGIHRIYFRLVSGIRNLYRDNKYIIPIHGFPRSLIFVYPLIGLVIKEERDRESLIVLHEKNTVYEFRSVVKGLFSKKTCYSTGISLGFAGNKIYAIAKMSGEHECGHVVIIGNASSRFIYREYEKVIPMGWNGQWYSFLNIKNKKIEHYIYLYNSYVVKTSIDKELYGDKSIHEHTMFHYDHRNNLVILRSDNKIKAIDLKRKSIRWQKDFSYSINMQNSDMFLDKIVVWNKHTVYVIDTNDGSIEYKHEFKEQITTSAITKDYLVIATSESLYLFTRREHNYSLYGKYVLPGEITGLHVYGDDMLITYKMPGNIMKAMYVSLYNPIEIRLKDVILVSNTAVEIPVKRYHGNLKLVRANSPYIQIVKHKGKIAIADQGSPPGTYNAVLQLDIPERLSILFDLNVKVEGLEKAFRKISIPNKLIYSPRGAYLPVTIVSDIPLDELCIILTSKDNTIYGSSPILSNIRQGEIIVPLYIAWAKSGKHSIELQIIGWNKRNRLYQKFPAQLIIDKDIPPLYSRTYGDTLYLWSPFNIENAEIIARTGNTSINIRQNIKRGWNEIETIRSIQDEIRVLLPSKVRCVIRRGKSWIEFLR